MKEDKFSKCLDALEEYLANQTDKEREEMMEFFRDDTPKGWCNIEEYLPKLIAMDVMQGYSEYKVKYRDGSEGLTRVADHSTWYYYAREEGIVSWFNE